MVLCAWVGLKYFMYSREAEFFLYVTNQNFITLCPGIKWLLTNISILNGINVIISINLILSMNEDTISPYIREENDWKGQTKMIVLNNVIAYYQIIQNNYFKIFVIMKCNDEHDWVGISLA